MFYRDAQALVIHIPRGACIRGDVVIHITFAFARHISQRGFKKVIWIATYLEGVVLELYESPRIPACRIASFFFVLLNASIFLGVVLELIVIANEFGLSRYIVFFLSDLETNYKI